MVHFCHAICEGRRVRAKRERTEETHPNYTSKPSRHQSGAEMERGWGVGWGVKGLRWRGGVGGQASGLRAIE